MGPVTVVRDLVPYLGRHCVERGSDGAAAYTGNEALNGEVPRTYQMGMVVLWVFLRPLPTDEPRGWNRK